MLPPLPQGEGRAEGAGCLPVAIQAPKYVFGLLRIDRFGRHVLGKAPFALGFPSHRRHLSTMAQVQIHPRTCPV
jgi:hypothetical protein